MDAGKNFASIIIRYLVIIAAAILDFYLFYLLFTPLTLYPVYWILSIFYSTALSGTAISVNSVQFGIISACIAGSAYYLLFILILATPMNAGQRIFSFLFCFSAFLALNIARIALLAVLLVNNFIFFDLVHLVLFYIVSILFVVGIWFANARLLKIKEIPVWSDIKFLKKKYLKK